MVGSIPFLYHFYKKEKANEFSNYFSKISSTHLAQLISMLQDDIINLNLARLILQEMFLEPTNSPITVSFSRLNYIPN